MEKKKKRGTLKKKRGSPGEKVDPVITPVLTPEEVGAVRERMEGEALVDWAEAISECGEDCEV